MSLQLPCGFISVVLDHEHRRQGLLFSLAPLFLGFYLLFGGGQYTHMGWEENSGVSSLLPHLCRFWGLNSGLQACQYPQNNTFKGQKDTPS